VSKDVTSATVKCKVKYASVSFDVKLQMLSDARIIRILHQKNYDYQFSFFKIQKINGGHFETRCTIVDFLNFVHCTSLWSSVSRLLVCQIRMCHVFATFESACLSDCTHGLEQLT